jgi:hypothetical protein
MSNIIDILKLSIEEIDQHFPGARFNEIARNTKSSYCDGILNDHLERWIKTNKIPGEFNECKVSEDLFFDKFYIRKKRSRFVNSDKFKGRISKDHLIDIFIIVTKKDDNYEKIYWYTLLNIPKDAKPTNLCVKGIIKFKEDDNDELFDRFKECIQESPDSDEAPDSDDEKREKIYKSIVIRKDSDEEDSIIEKKPESSKKIESTGGASKEEHQSTDEEDEEEEDEEEDDNGDEEVEKIDVFKNKTTFHNYLKDNNLRSKKILKANVEDLDKNDQKKFKDLSKTQELIDAFFKLKIVPKKM